MQHTAKHTLDHASITSVQHTSSHAAVLFVICTLIVLLIPLIGMLWAPTTSTTENRELADTPSLTTESGTPNIHILADAGTYFEDHFAYRNNLVDANAHMRATLGIAATDQVVVGHNDWLYYGGTLSDYVGAAPLSDRALFAIAHNLAQLQAYAKSRGAQFIFAVAPNKNTLYAQDMPTHYLQSPNPSNYKRLLPYLQQAGVVTLDLQTLFEQHISDGERLYYLRDTHWTNEGALLATNALLTKLGTTPLSIPENAWVVRQDFTGDVAGMLYPVFPGTESEAYVSGINDGSGASGAAWHYTEGSSVTDDFITTKATAEKTEFITRFETGSETASKTGSAKSKTTSLMMYRDSFGNALLPYFSTVFPQATYSKLVPYNASSINTANADVVIVERAERHLSYLAETAFLMPAPRVKANPSVLQENAVDCALTTTSEGNYLVINGSIDAQLVQHMPTTTRIFVTVPLADGTRATYDAALTVGSDSAEGASAGDISSADASSAGASSAADVSTSTEDASPATKAQASQENTVNQENWGFCVRIPRDQVPEDIKTTSITVSLIA